MATEYKDRFADSMKTLSEQTLKHRFWLSDQWLDTEVGKDKNIKMLEYACGPGVISMTLAPFVSQVIGFDVSDNMIDEFNRNAKNIDISHKMIGYKADLLSTSVPDEYMGPKFTDFNMVTVSMALHHFEYPQEALQSLSKRLSQNGVFMIIDILSRSGSDHAHAHAHGHGHGHGEGNHEFGDAAHTVKTHGFSKEDMQGLFAGAGLTKDFKYEVIPEPLIFQKGEKKQNITVFIARAQRP
ncbi:hypothetical protein VI817_005214 [Penicillium citrinum]|nr:hypothetical protein VI817_005214 [Penicillium citrinum]